MTVQWKKQPFDFWLIVKCSQFNIFPLAEDLNLQGLVAVLDQGRRHAFEAALWNDVRSYG